HQAPPILTPFPSTLLFRSHRDIKPSNILANAEGEPRLLDFGIAKLLAKDESQLTAEAQQHLTPICASPEQAKGDPITVATDIYSDRKSTRLNSSHQII